MQSWWDKRRYRLFWQALEDMDTQYDDQWQLLARTAEDRAYTQRAGNQVHPTRESLVYAAALLDSERAASKIRAHGVLERVLSLQDTDPNSPHCGLWPWHLEEPLIDMPVPDPNWADFCSVQLLQILRDHDRHLPPSLLQKAQTALQLAVDYIVRRDVHPGYTNIAVMGTYASLVGGLYLGDRSFAVYGAERLAKVRDFFYSAGILEYNSPTYTAISLREAARLLHHLEEPDHRRAAKDIYDILFQHWLRRFHRPTRQWAGPYSRSYGSFADKSRLTLLQLITNETLLPEDELRIGSDYLRMPFPIPEDVSIPPTPASRLEQEVFLRDPKRPLQGYSRLTPHCAFGSVNLGLMWSQSRNVTLHWGHYPAVGYLGLRAVPADQQMPPLLYTVQNELCLLGLLFILPSIHGSPRGSMDVLWDVRRLNAESPACNIDADGRSAAIQAGGDHPLSIAIQMEPATADSHMDRDQHGACWKTRIDTQTAVQWGPALVCCGFAVQVSEAWAADAPPIFLSQDGLAWPQAALYIRPPDIPTQPSSLPRLLQQLLDPEHTAIFR